MNATEALRNLHRMDRMGWFGPYGFYEAADYGPLDKVRRSSGQRRPLAGWPITRA